jgi:cell wall-associated NlpC family hydrolase
MKLHTNDKKSPLIILATITIILYFSYATEVTAAPLMDIPSYTDQKSPYTNEQNQRLFVPGTVNTNTYIRQHPYATSNILVEATKGEILEVVGNYNEWVAINFHMGIAYVHSSYIDQSKTLMASTNSPIINNYPSFAIVSPQDGLFAQLGDNPYDTTKLSNGSTFEVLGSGGNYTNVLVTSNYYNIGYKLVYIYNGEFVWQPYPPLPPVTPDTSNPKGVQIVTYAKQFLGTPYVWGGTDLIYGVDCSGFTFTVMQNNGVNINRVSRDQALNGTTVERHELQKADLVFFDTSGPINNGNISHVGLYIGNGYFIHASSSPIRPYVIISNLNDAFYANTYVSASRVI